MSPTFVPFPYNFLKKEKKPQKRVFCPNFQFPLGINFFILSFSSPLPCG